MFSFVAKDGVSRQLLKSVPRKFIAWLDNIGFPTYGNDSFGDIVWSLDLEKSWVKVKSSDITISWTGSASSPNWVAGSDPRFESIIDNMDFFVSVEKSIYDELEKLQQQRESISSQPEPEVDRRTE